MQDLNTENKLLLRENNKDLSIMKRHFRCVDQMTIAIKKKKINIPLVNLQTHHNCCKTPHHHEAKIIKLPL